MVGLSVVFAGSESSAAVAVVGDDRAGAELVVSLHFLIVLVATVDDLPLIAMPCSDVFDVVRTVLVVRLHHAEAQRGPRRR